MIYKCENCKNKSLCPYNKKGYSELCKMVEEIDRINWFDAYYSLILKCDYWVNEKQDIGVCCK